MINDKEFLGKEFNQLSNSNFQIKTLKSSSEIHKKIVYPKTLRTVKY